MNVVAILEGLSNVYVDDLSRRLMDSGAFAATAKFPPEFENIFYMLVSMYLNR